MSETVINLFLDILAAVYTNFAILYFSRRLLPVRNKISLFFLLILFTLPMSLCFLMKRSTLSGEFTILISFLSWVVFLLDSMPLFCKSWLFILFSYY
ncbi:hypothetical protein G4952_03785 [Blautia wexlerae]|uniref:Histidine kinase N-terminal 7TM region domain-containing protein n=1 Tax=Blautia wexlerae TaxID=418240 RepID=A0ABX2GMK0_9FIRM|nr:hypothetical protein [Blautia wexlerae]NSF72957.1 hypothetical protein [Blautia wexlerae]